MSSSSEARVEVVLDDPLAVGRVREAAGRASALAHRLLKAIAGIACTRAWPRRRRPGSPARSRARSRREAAGRGDGRGFAARGEERERSYRRSPGTARPGAPSIPKLQGMGPYSPCTSPARVGPPRVYRTCASGVAPSQLDSRDACPCRPGPKPVGRYPAAPRNKEKEASDIVAVGAPVQALDSS